MSASRLTMDEFCELVAEVIADLPEHFHDWMENVVVDVELRPSRKVLQELGHESGHALMGLFQGQPITEQEYGRRHPNRITLFKAPIEAICRSRDEVAYEIRRTVLHELAHHFGYSEEDLDFFEERPSPFDDE